MMQESVFEKSDQLSFIIIEIGGEEFVIDLLEAKEIIQVGQIRRLPKSFDYVEGIYNYRGDIIHIINPKKKLKIEQYKFYKTEAAAEENNGSELSFIIIVSIANKYLGFLVDRIINVAHVASEAIIGLNPIVQTKVNVDFIKGIVKFEDRPRIWLNLKKVLSESEKSLIKSEIIK